MVDKKTILLIDDDATIHAILKTMLEPEWNVLYALNAQQGIDLLSEHTVHLLLLDIQMPDLSGLDLLESVMIDTSIQNIPVIIVTGDPTIEVRRRSKDLGAVSFVSKEHLITQRKEIICGIRNNMMIDGVRIKIPSEIKETLKNAIRGLLEQSRSGDLFTACNGLGAKLIKAFDLSYISFWTLPAAGFPNLISSMGKHQPKNFGPSEILREKIYANLVLDKKPYLSNNPRSSKSSAFGKEALELQLASEIGVPIYKMTKSDYFDNNMKVPASCDIIGFIILKRNRVFTTKEYEIIEAFLLQAGIILNAIYSSVLGEKPRIY